MLGEDIIIFRETGRERAYMLNPFYALAIVASLQRTTTYLHNVIICVPLNCGPILVIWTVTAGRRRERALKDY